jgi:Flp pilus assembly protein TadB
LRAGARRKARKVTAIILIGLTAAVIVGVSLVFGGPIVGAILATVLIVGGIVWLVALGRSGKTPGQVAREAPDHELLGPGGPDDPNR